MSERPDTHISQPGGGPPGQPDPRPPSRPVRPSPLQRPSDPAGTRPKVHPDQLRPSGEFRALPAGEPADSLPEPAARASVPEVRSTPPGPPPHAPRFQFLLGAFGALALAAIALAASVALAPKAKPPPPWSSWKPTGDVDPAVQIAEHVAPEYTRSPGNLLVRVTGGPQQIGGQPVVVALRSSGSEAVPLENNGVFYQLCGTGANCTIPGKASIQRGLLVRREALELALYTFHYVSTASQVLVTLPPASPTPAKGAKKAESSSSASSSPSAASSSAEGLEGLSSSSASHVPSTVLLFRREDLAAELSVPIDATLSAVNPSVATIAKAPEAQLVDQLTGRLVYDSTLIPEQQSSPVLLLQQRSIGG